MARHLRLVLIPDAGAGPAALVLAGCLGAWHSRERVREAGDHVPRERSQLRRRRPGRSPFRARPLARPPGDGLYPIGRHARRQTGRRRLTLHRGGHAGQVDRVAVGLRSRRLAAHCAGTTVALGGKSARGRRL